MVMLYTASTMVKLPSMDSILVLIIKIEWIIVNEYEDSSTLLFPNDQIF